MHFETVDSKAFQQRWNDENSAGCIFQETFFHGNAAIY